MIVICFNLLLVCLLIIFFLTTVNFKVQVYTLYTRLIIVLLLIVSMILLLLFSAFLFYLMFFTEKVFFASNVVSVTTTQIIFFCFLSCINTLDILFNWDIIEWAVFGESSSWVGIHATAVLSIGWQFMCLVDSL